MDRKNIIFIMADQLRYDAIAAHGNEDVLTPNLDRLSSMGCDVENYFTNSPVCVPSRCSLITGKYLHSHGIKENHTVLEENREIHMFRILKQNGYKLGYSGKNHVLKENEFENFDYWNIEDQQRYSEEERACKDYMSNKAREYGSWGYRVASSHNYPKEVTGAWKWTTHMIDFLDQVKDSSEPFCGFLSIVEPHFPHVAPKEIWDMYDEDSISVPTVIESDLNQKANRYVIKQKAQRSDKTTLEDKKRWLHAYYSLVTLVDLQVGRIMSWLEENGKAENTILVVTSDHGDFAFEHGLYKKDLVLLDCLLHVPLMINCKGLIPSNKMSKTLVEQVDVLPTILDLLDIEIPRGVQGKSIYPILQGKSVQHKEAVYAEINPPWLFNKFETYEQFSEFWRKKGAKDHPFNVPGDFSKSVRTMDFRYVWYGNGEEELYDIKKDPGETINLAQDPNLKNIKLELKLQLLEWNALSENPVDPALNARLQKEFDSWKGTNGSNYEQWLPYWFENEYLLD